MSINFKETKFNLILTVNPDALNMVFTNSTSLNENKCLEVVDEKMSELSKETK